jgi:hypothetical protein
MAYLSAVDPKLIEWTWADVMDDSSHLPPQANSPATERLGTQAWPPTPIWNGVHRSHRSDIFPLKIGGQFCSDGYAAVG